MLLNVQITTEYPMWFIIFCLLLGIVYSFFLYRKEEKFKDLAVWIVQGMAFCRFLLVSLLTFLLLSPFIKTVFNKVEKPVVIIAQDNSGSILLNKDSVFYKTEYLEQLELLQEKLSEKYNIKPYVFGEDVAEGNEINYSKKITNISNLFDEVNSRFYNRNVGALILASDGIFNQGTNPVFSSSNISFPVYIIALGDTAVQKDLLIRQVDYNKITFLGNEFPLEINAIVQECKGTKTKLRISHNGEEVYAKDYDITSDQFTITESILLEAKQEGVQHYSLQFSNIEGEISTINNKRDVYVEVLDGRQNVLVLAKAPHPDIKALKLSIESNENYKVTTAFFDDFDFNLEPYNLLIMHQIPENYSRYREKLNKVAIPILYIIGNQTKINQLNLLNIGVEIKDSRGQFSRVLPSISENFPLFGLTDHTKKVSSSFPPLVAPFGTYQLKKNGYVLFNQKIGSIETSNPLMVFFQNEGKKIGILNGEGIWKWRMQEFASNNNHIAFNEIINKTVQYLSVKEDKSKFRLISANRFLENEEILFNAELYNDSYELVNDPEISISFTDKSSNQYDFAFSKTSTSYFLNAGILPIGFYNYKALVKYGGKEYIEEGKFQVKELLMEANGTIANHQMLQNISKKTGGKLFYPLAMDDLSKEILNDEGIVPVIYEEKELKDLINLRWIFMVLIFLLTIEWFLRKRNGAY